jgi:DNA-binding NarL/FixJ family response regulator
MGATERRRTIERHARWQRTQGLAKHTLGPALPPTREDAQRLLATLSKRQREFVELVARGLSDAECAERMFIERASVKDLAHEAYARLGVRGRTEALLVYWRAEKGE